jgi:hypothetical protein
VLGVARLKGWGDLIRTATAGATASGPSGGLEQICTTLQQRASADTIAVHRAVRRVLAAEFEAVDREVPGFDGGVPDHPFRVLRLRRKQLGQAGALYARRPPGSW